MKDTIIKLLKDTNRSGIDELIDWLEETDYFTAPASTKYHLSKEGGLAEHSLNVYAELTKEWTDDCHEMPRYDMDTLAIVSLLHDICKVNLYSVSEKNVKIGDKWVKEPYYIIDDKFPLGHGEKSVILLQRFIKLTDDEIMAIRWHMGAYEPKENYNSLKNAFSKCPLAMLLHIADLKATYFDEGDKNE